MLEFADPFYRDRGRGSPGFDRSLWIKPDSMDIPHEFK
jgi:hypothetical protein